MLCPKTLPCSTLLSQKLEIFNQGLAGAAAPALCLVGKKLHGSSGKMGKIKILGVAELKENASLAQELISLGIPEPSSSSSRSSSVPV